MQHDYFQKKNVLTPPQGLMVRVRIEYVLAYYCMCHSLYLDMQHDYVPKKLNFDLLISSQILRRGSIGKIFATMFMHVSFPLI